MRCWYVNYLLPLLAQGSLRSTRLKALAVRRPFIIGRDSARDQDAPLNNASPKPHFD